MHGIRTDIPQRPEIWGDLCGWYRPRAQRTDMMAWSILGAGAEVTFRRGQLMVRTLSPIPALYRGFQLHPDDQEDPYVFRLDLSKYGLGTVRVVFSRDRSGKTTRFHLDGILLSAEKYPRSINPRLWATGAVGVLAAATTVRALRRLRAGCERADMSLTTSTELWRMSAMELAEAIRTKQVSSHEVIEAHLRRIEAVNPSINAVVIVMAEQALKAAKAADRAVAAGAVLPPLHGVPFTVKENLDVAGTPTTQGFKALANAYPRRDAPVVERLKAAGAIPIGRTNLPSGAIRWHCESELWGANCESLGQVVEPPAPQAPARPPLSRPA